MLRSLVLLLVTTLFAAPASALVLVKNGRPTGEVILPAVASRAEVFVADDFQRWVKEITGATVPVLRTPTAMSNTKVFIGKSLASEWRQELAQLAGSDGFAVRRKENRVYIFGDVPRGTAYGVYRLLEMNTDIIWARPDEKFGTVFGKTPSLELKSIDVLEKPFFSIRGWNVVAIRKHRPSGIWVFRNRGNFADQTETPDLELLDLFGGGHAYFSTMVPPTHKFGDGKHKYFSTDPEFYGWDETKNRRVAETLCLTNPRLPTEAAANLVKGIRKLPRKPDYLWLGMRDTWAMCQCPECQKTITLQDGTELTMRSPDAERDPLFHSTQYFLFMNRIAEEFKKTYPGIKILVSAYLYAAEPPACELDDVIRPLFSPVGGRNARYPLLDENQDKTWRERFIKWRQKVPDRLCLYEYYRSYSSGEADIRYGPIQSSWTPDLRGLAFSGGQGVISELTPDVEKNFSNHSMQSEWDANSIDAWLLARLFWNPNQDVVLLRDYYLERTYREAAPAMKRFYALLQNGWSKCSTPKKGFQCYVVDAGVEKNSLRALEEAEILAKHPNALEMIKRLKAQWIQSATGLGRIYIPSVPEAKDALTFDSLIWRKARVLRDFRHPANWNWGDPIPPKATTEVRVLQDGETLYFRYMAAAPGNAGFDIMPKKSSDTWPIGDHAEIYLKNMGDNYLFAFDGNGNAYDALGYDKRWHSAWQLQTRKADRVWEAILVIPLADLKFKADAGGTELALFIMRHLDAGGMQEESTLNGGILGRTYYPVVME